MTFAGNVIVEGWEIFQNSTIVRFRPILYFREFKARDT